LLVDEIIRLVKQAEGDVGDYWWRTGFDKFPVVFIARRRLAAKVSNVLGSLESLSHCGRSRAPKVVAVVVQQFFETGASDTR